MSRTSISSKMIKTRLLLPNPGLARHVPETRILTRHRLRLMLEKYRMVYVKPDSGSMGIGVVRVKKGRHSYRYKSGQKTRTFGSFSAMYRSLRGRTGGRLYLVQKGIRVLKYRGRPFDFRVMIQRDPNRVWQNTGTVGRLAHPLKAVTNGSQGGTIYPSETLLRRTVGPARARRMIRGMNRLARLTAAQFGRRYPGMNELGLDIAIDRNLYPWILEVNTTPDPCPFALLEDKNAIRRIVAYGKAYGRHYRLTCTKAKKAPG